MTDPYMQMLFALALVVCVILFMGLGLKKKRDMNGLMKVLAYQPLGQKKGIAAVQVGREVLLVGVTSTDLKLLKTFDDNFDTGGAEKTTAADITEKLKKLRAMKDTLYAVK